MKLVSWNVNGLRAIYKKGFNESIEALDPDILCLQETRAEPAQLPKGLLKGSAFPYVFHNPSRARKGYSGTAIYSRLEPESVELGLGDEYFDREGRTIVADFGAFILYNIYYPNGQRGQDRLDYKMAFYEAFLEHANHFVQQGRRVVICGDVNTAHTEIDIARPKENAGTSGFLPIERAFLDKWFGQGYLDTFRLFNQDGGHYTWWDYMTRARERNVGWRIDYFVVSDNVRPYLVDAYIHSDIFGSDHCPVSVTLDGSIVSAN